MGFFFFFQAEDGIRDSSVTGVQTCALPISTIPFAIRSSTVSGASRVPVKRRPTTTRDERDVCQIPEAKSSWFCLRGWDQSRRQNHDDRSEEHTSELQSHLNLVCRLLLEKKKTKS